MVDVPFDFVFLIPLRNVNRNCSLLDIILTEHEQLRNTDANLIKTVLNGQTNHKVLLLLDGYDEYTPGTNADIDKVMQSSVGKCFTIITSRPEHDSKHTKTKFVSMKVRNAMDGEVIIEGFSQENTKRCSTKFLESENRSKEMLNQAKKKWNWSITLCTYYITDDMCTFWGKWVFTKSQKLTFFEQFLNLSWTDHLWKSLVVKLLV